MNLFIFTTVKYYDKLIQNVQKGHYDHKKCVVQNILNTINALGTLSVRYECAAAISDML